MSLRQYELRLALVLPQTHAAVATRPGVFRSLIWMYQFLQIFQIAVLKVSLFVQDSQIGYLNVSQCKKKLMFLLQFLHDQKTTAQGRHRKSGKWPVPTNPLFQYAWKLQDSTEEPQDTLMITTKRFFRCEIKT